MSSKPSPLASTVASAAASVSFASLPPTPPADQLELSAVASSSSSMMGSPHAPVTFHNSDYDLWDAWLHKIYESTQQDNWFMPSEEIVSTGVAMRVEDGFFRVFPYENPALVPFEAAVRKLNPVVAVKMRSAAVHAALRKVDTNEDSVYIDQNTRIQVIESIDQLPLAEKDQCGAFIRDERSVVLPPRAHHPPLQGLRGEAHQAHLANPQHRSQAHRIDQRIRFRPSLSSRLWR